MNIKKIVKSLESADNPDSVKEIVLGLKFEERFNALRELIYHIDLFFSEENLEGAEKCLDIAEKLSIYVDVGFPNRMPEKVRSLKIITRKKRAKFYENKGDTGRAIKQYRRIIEALNLPAEESFLAEMLMEVGIIEERTGRKKEALEKFTQASEICGKRGDTFNYEASLFNCAHVLYDMSYYFKAEEFCRAVIKHNKKQEKVLSPVAHSYLELANISELYNKDEEAKVYYKKSLDCYRSLGERVKMSDILNRIGSYELQSGNFSGALAIFEESLDIKKSIDYIQGKARVYEIMGDTLRMNGSPREALKYYNFAYYFFEESGSGGRKTIIKQKIHRILTDLHLITEDLGTFIEGFRKKLPDLVEVINLEKLDYADRRGEGYCQETIREWHMPHRARVSRKFLFYLVRNLAKVHENLGNPDESQVFRTMKDAVEKRIRKRRESP